MGGGVKLPDQRADRALNGERQVAWKIIQTQPMKVPRRQMWGRKVYRVQPVLMISVLPRKK